MNYTRAGSSDNANMTLEKINLAIDVIKESQAKLLADENKMIAWMINEGYDPADGGILILPRAMVSMHNNRHCLPKFVRVSAHVQTPLLMNEKYFNLPSL